MGNKNSKIHLETAQKTGACTLSNMNLEEKDVPEALFKIEKLRSLDISQNKIRIIPPELGKLANLKMLNLSGNRCTKIDQNLINNWTKLETLLASSLLLTSFPNFEKCKNLKKVNYSDLRG